MTELPVVADPAPAPDPIAHEVQDVLESPATAKVIRAILVWLLSSHDNPVLRRFSSVLRAGLVWAMVHLNAHGAQGQDTQAIVEQVTAWILGSGVAITWVLHMFYDRLMPVVETWLDKHFPKVKVQVTK